LRFKKNVIHPIFFYEWLKSKGGKALFMRRAGQTAVQFNVNSVQIGEIEIPLPPHLTQMTFVTLFKKVRELYQHSNCSSEGSTQLFNDLLHEPLKGNCSFKGKQFDSYWTEFKLAYILKLNGRTNESMV